MEIDLDIWEIYKILEQGTANQQVFIQECKEYDCYEEAIHILDFLQSFDTIRGLLNGGSISINNDDHEENNEMVFDLGDGAYLHFTYGNYYNRRL